MAHSELVQAIEADDVEAIRQLVGANPALLDARLGEDADTATRGFSPLHLAAFRGRESIERELVRLGADPDVLNAEGRTPLHVALEYNNTTTDVLIELGANVDVCAAASLGRLERLRALLDADAGLANDESTGLSPLGWAAYFCATESANLLLDRGARTGPALMCAAQVSCVQVGRLLIERGADPNESHESWGGRAIHAAAGMRHTPDSRPFVDMLLEAGADVNARTTDGRTALGIARSLRDAPRTEGAEDGRAYGDLVALLESRGAVE